MTTPDPAPAPFNPHAFPNDLVAAQRTAAELYAKLHALQARLPWSREPHDGWPEETERGRQHPGRPATDGWPEDDAAEFDKLLEELRKATATVQCHGWWERCKKEGTTGADLVAARMALKHAPGAVPDAPAGKSATLEPGDVQQAA
ncbi:hypothetical protein [Streptomyces griseomycini]|uniref:Uncharacterized protein n=1 Tax=Streptomyces griseomycini TaxID=66895 RepID=A0A7W7PWI3_9ACTN|nr:hypothetical protein [Streptomyces griseomycini]MBB4902575.1 hypothetical protein [Streptomyces griseomycini]GGR54262.1 hypothetical protein GCM10015536_69460 [Streptomyces griseomycini]